MSLLAQVVTTVGSVMLAFLIKHMLSFALKLYWHEFDRGVERRKRRRENLEKLAMLAVQHHEYLKNDLRRAAFDAEYEIKDPFPDIFAMQALHFDELNELMLSLTDIRLKNVELLTEIEDKRANNQQKHPNTDQWFKEVNGTSLAWLDNFIRECRALIDEDEVWLANTWRRRWRWTQKQIRPRRLKAAE